MPHASASPGNQITSGQALIYTTPQKKGTFRVAKSKSRTTSSSSGSEPNAIVRYFQDTRAELRRVTWPTREETQNLTMIIVAVTVAMAFFLGALDYIFQIIVAGIIAGDLVRIGIAIVLLLAGAGAFYYNSQEV
ncbi:MAG: preprotein translocase subunit SecE [Chloroflexi bacterium]|nr:MAG: preprotein translocase subunit SecE [Chloroflexota bacterium]